MEGNIKDVDGQVITLVDGQTWLVPDKAVITLNGMKVRLGDLNKSDRVKLEGNIVEATR